jgi:magnesium chelatase subunit D
VNGAETWADAITALALFVADPAGCGGVSVRAGPGPVRDRWLALLCDALPPGTSVRRVPPHVPDDRLLGGLDLAATLRAGRPIGQTGLLAESDGGVLLLAMAERTEPAVTARLCSAMDLRTVTLLREGLTLRLAAHFGLVALDEGITPDERTPAGLLDRMAFQIDLGNVALRDLAHDLMERPLPLQEGAGSRSDAASNPGSCRSSAPGLPSPRPQWEGEELSPATNHARPLAIEPGDAAAALCASATALGIESIRAPLLALSVARTVAAADSRIDLALSDLALAARLVLAPRAIRLPEAKELPPPPPGDPPLSSDEATGDDPAIGDRPLDNTVLAAARSALSSGLLSRMPLGTTVVVRSSMAGRAGQNQASARHGRPIGTHRGDPRSGAQLHLLETLKAALPWQSLRRASDSISALRIEVRRDDFRIVRFRRRTQTTAVFAVDASGSSALHRLAEAKGAVELLLADCYVRRDQVALIAFRGRSAEILLPPTGSLLRAKRCLAALPGGGATPLAAGIDAAAALADAERRKGRTPLITLLTDGQANITRDGNGSRRQGEDEALAAGRLVRDAGIASLLVDTSPRPNPFARRLAEEMRARYVALPYVDAAALSKAVRSAAAA